MTLRLSLSAKRHGHSLAPCRDGLEKRTVSRQERKRPLRYNRLILATVMAVAGIHGHALAKNTTVKIGAGDYQHLNSLINTHPGLTLNDIEFTSDDKYNPGILAIDSPSGLSGHLVASHYGGIDFTAPNASFSPAGRTLSGSAKYMGGIFSFTKDFTFQYTGKPNTSLTLNLKDNHVQGDGGAIYSEASLWLSDSSVFDNNVVDYASGSGSMILSKRPTFGSGGAIWVNGNLTVSHNTRFTGNLSYGGYGGAIYSKKGSVTFGDNAVLEENKSVSRSFRGSHYRSDGGAIWAAKNVTFGAAASLKNNEAASGGAIYSEGSVAFGDNTVSSTTTLSGNQALGGFNYQNNNGGSGGAVYATGDIAFGSRITLENNSAVAAGGALYSAKGSVSFSSKALLKSNTARGDGGAIRAQKDVTFGDDATLQSNSASGNGGAILASSGAVTFGDWAKLSDNTAENYGGAIDAVKGNVSFGKKATLSGNGARQHDGGAIYAPSSGVSFGTDAVISGNWSGGGRGGAVYAQDAISFDFNSTLNDNEAVSTQWGYGGALYSQKGSITFSRTASLSGNKAGLDGGAVWAAGSINFYSDTTIAGNSAKNDGGAAYSAADIILTNNATLQNNSAGQEGGALKAAFSIRFRDDALLKRNTAGRNGGAVFASGNLVSFDNHASLLENSTGGYGGALLSKGDVLFGTDATLSGNYAGLAGGAVYAGMKAVFGDRATLTSNSADDNGGTVYTKGAEFGDDARLEGNSVLKHDGGAVYASSGPVTFGNGASLSGNSSRDGLAGAVYAGSSISFGDNATVSGNHALNDDWGYGGALYMKSGLFTFGNDATLSDNQAGREGGAIWSGDTLRFGSDATLSGNSARVDGGAVYSKSSVTFGDRASLLSNRAGQYGGAVYANRFSVGFGDQLTLAGNEAARGGAVYAPMGNVVFGNGAVVTGNRATDSRGGAIYAKESVSAGDDALFSDNRAQGDGGAIYTEAPVDFGSNATLSGNRSVASGGAIATRESVSFGDNATLSGNSSDDQSGGAVYAFSGPVTFGNDATLSGNSAGLMGGVVFTQGNISLGDRAVVSDNRASSATLGYGGAFYSVHGSFTAGDAAMLTGNISGSDGGAVWAQDDSATFGDLAILSDNRSGGSGGAVFAGKDAVFGNDATLSGNTSAGDGGAIYAARKIIFGTHASFSDNTATGKGGALYAAKDLEFMDGASFTGNRAGSGGAIYAKNASVSLNALTEDVVFSGNTAAGQASAIFMDGNGLDLRMNAAAGRTIALDDPVSSNGTLRISINDRTRSGTVSVSHYQSQLPQSVTDVYSGTFSLTDGAVWGGSGSRFYLHEKSVLASGGNSTLDAGEINLYDRTQLAFDLASVQETAPGTGTFEPVLNFTSAAHVQGLVHLDLLAIQPHRNTTGTDRTFTLVSGWGNSDRYDPTLTLRGNPIENTRIKGKASVYVDNGDLKMTLKPIENYRLTWTGNYSNLWGVTGPKNWTDESVPPTERMFFDGDSVVFSSGAPDPYEVAIDPSGNVVADMTVEQGHFIFTGGNILADKNASTLTDASGLLTVKAGAVADLGKITGNNRFDGVELGGTLVLADMGQLGTTFGKVALKGTSPTLAFDAAAFDVRGAGNDENRLTGSDDAMTLNLDARNGSIVSFMNSRSADDGGAVALAGGLNMNDGFRFLLNHSDKSGGAIRAKTVTFGQNAVLAGNTAGENGGAVLTADSYAAFGEKASLVLNKAGQSGGAIHSGQAVLFSHEASLLHNTAGTDGGALWTQTSAVFGDSATLAYNKAGGDGGAIRAGTTVDLGENAILESNAARTGGAVYAEGDITVGNAATVRNNTAQANGGALASGANIAFADNATLTGNSATDKGGALFANGKFTAGTGMKLLLNTAGQSGGAVSAATLFLGDDARLAFNRAGTSGGALYSPSLVTVGDRTIFIRNSAGTDGGALATGGDFTAGKNPVFSGNTAAGSGGAISAENDVTLPDGGNFLNNSAGIAGGAIAAGGTVTLKALTKDILFSGNTAGGQANAIHMTGSGTPVLTLSARDGRTIALNDPVTGGTSANPVTAAINQADTDGDYTGTVRLTGHRSDIATDTTVHNGTFELADGAVWGAPSPVAGTAFTVASGAALKISGREGTGIAADNIAFNERSLLVFDPASYAGDKAILTLTGSTVTADPAVKISVSSIMRHKGAEIDLVEAGTTDFTPLGDDNLYYKEAHVVDTRMNGLLTLDTTNAGIIRLRQTHDLENLDLVWTGNIDGNWNYTTKNWKDAQPDRLFFDGDAVVFDDSGQTRDITVNPYGVTVVSMTVAGGQYRFSGGSIGSANRSSLDGWGTMLVKNGATADFTGDLSFEGGYTVEKGAVMAFSGTQIQGDIASDGAFTLHTDEETTLVYRDNVTGSGTFDKTGKGRFELGGSLFQASLTVREGTLAFDEPGATVATRNGTFIQSGATLETGNGGAVAGDLSMESGAVLDIAGAMLFTVTGNADLSDAIGTTLSYNGWQDHTVYPVLQSGSFSRTFTARTLDYTDGRGTLMRNGSYLVFVTGDPREAWPKGRTFNQKSTLAAIAALPDANPVRDILVLGENGARAAADLASGEGYVSTGMALMERMRTEAFKTGARLSDRAFRRSESAGISSAPGADRKSDAWGDSLWVDLGGYQSTFDGNDNAARTRLEGPELAAGLDLEAGDGWLAGAAVRFGSLTSRTEARHHKADIDTYSLTLYGGREIPAGPGTLRLVAGAGYTYSDIDARRTVAFSGVYRHLDSEYNAQGWQTFAEAAYTFPADDYLSFEPYLNVSHDSLHTGKFTENADTFALTGESDTFSTTTSLLGIRYRFNDRKTLSVRTNLGWMHTYGSLDPLMTHRFAGTAVSFPIEGVRTNRNAAVAGIGAVFRTGKNTSVSLGYDGIFGKDNVAHTGQLQWTLSW